MTADYKISSEKHICRKMAVAYHKFASWKKLLYT